MKGSALEHPREAALRREPEEVGGRRGGVGHVEEDLRPRRRERALPPPHLGRGHPAQHRHELVGRAQPAAGTLGASKIFYLDFSDDPWAEASVRSATDASLPFCLTTCDGCGHCGAGVPAKKSACFDKSDAWVDKLLLEARVQAPQGAGVVVEA